VVNRRSDPDFWTRVHDVCGVYLNCPDNAIVLSVDEKTSVQAKQRKHKDQPPAANRRIRREWEYIRHGTASLFAALNVHSGEVLAEPIPGKNDSVNFCAAGLVVCRGFSKGGSAAFDLGDDVVDGLGPDERFGVVVPV
jgi:hypothetical protein